MSTQNDTTDGGTALVPSEKVLYRATPSSAALNELQTVLTFLPYLKEDPRETGRKMRSSKRVKYWITQGESDNDRDITFESRAGKITFHVPDVEAFRRENPGLLKQFAFFTQLIRESAANGGALIKDRITFDKKRLVELGIYSTDQSARVGFDNAKEVLRQIGISGTFKTGNGKRFIVSASESIFPKGYRDNKGLCTVELSETAPWPALLESNTVRPDYPFQLRPKAWALSELVLSRARQCVDEILDKGFFTVSAEAVRCWLALPGPKFGKNPWRDGPEAMKKAASELMEAHKAALHNSDLVLAFEHKDKGKKLTEFKTVEFLKNALLKVTVSGELLKELCKVSGRQLEPPQAKGESPND